MNKKYSSIFYTLLCSLIFVSCQPVLRPISLANAPSIEQTALVDLAFPGSIAWSTDSSALFIYTSQQIKVINGTTLETSLTRSAEQSAYILDINTINQLYIETADNMTFNAKSITSGELVQSITYPTYAISSIFSPDGKSIAIASADTWQVDLYDVETGLIQDSLTGFETAAPVYGIQFSRDGNHLLYFARGTLQSQEISSHQMDTAIFHEDFISTFTSSPDGVYLLSAAAGMLEEEYKLLVYLWDRKDGSRIATLPIEPYVSALDYTADGKMIAISSGDVLYLAEAETLDIIATIETGLESIISIRISPDGSQIATMDSVGKLALFALP